MAEQNDPEMAEVMKMLEAEPANTLAAANTRKHPSSCAWS